MATSRDKKGPQRPPATTRKGREDQLIAAAIDLAERQINDGTATSQVITHYLKLGSTREELEQARLRSENELLKAKINNMVSAERIDELYAQAIAAMRRYQGHPEETVEE